MSDGGVAGRNHRRAAASDGSGSTAVRAGSHGRPAHPVIDAVAPVVDALGATLVPAEEQTPADVALMWEGETIAAVRLPALHDALGRMIDGVEAELGGKLAGLPREGKQRAIRMLDERGAFVLRRAVDDIADAMGVSRITVYNYLNAINR